MTFTKRILAASITTAFALGVPACDDKKDDKKADDKKADDKKADDKKADDKKEEEKK